MAFQVEIRSVVYPLELFPAEREIIFNVDRLFSVMRQLFRRVLVEAKVFAFNSKLLIPSHPLVFPFLKLFFVILRTDKILHFHLFELKCAEDKISRSYFISERFSYLSDSERYLLTACVNYVFEVNIYSLSGLGPQVADRSIIFNRSHVSFEHQVKFTCFR